VADKQTVLTLTRLFMSRNKLTKLGLRQLESNRKCTKIRLRAQKFSGGNAPEFLLQGERECAVQKDLIE
jgi:hypothetical protein